jgi:hypothetical protein
MPIPSGQNQKLKVKNKNDKSKCKTHFSSPLMGEEKCEGEIPLTLALSRQGRENYKVRLLRPEIPDLIGDGLAMTVL